MPFCLGKDVVQSQGPNKLIGDVRNKSLLRTCCVNPHDLRVCGALAAPASPDRAVARVLISQSLSHLMQPADRARGKPHAVLGLSLDPHCKHWVRYLTCRKRHRDRTEKQGE